MKDIEQIKENFNKLIEKYKPLTKENIINKLKEIKVEESGPFHIFSFLVFNEKYDPDNFSQEIEGSEENLESWNKIYKEINKPEFDFIWNNTLSKLPKNSEKWHNNHNKICPVKTLYNELFLQCVVYDDGTRDFISEEIVNKILKVQEKYKIIDFC